MSLILDALKRAERERRGEAVPTHAEVPLVSAGGAAPRRGKDLVYAAVVAGGLALSAVLLWDAFRARPAPQPEPQAPAPAPALTQAPAVVVARPAPPQPATVVPGTEAVTSLDDLTDESTLDAPGATPALVPKPSARAAKPAVQTGDRPEGIATRPVPPPATARAAEVPPTPAPQRAQPAPEVRSEPAPAKPEPAPAAPPQETAPAAVAPAEIPPALTQPAPLRKFREMPPDYRADFPALKVEIHVYEKQAQRRFVMVNGRKYREGERLAEGPSLVEIVPDGMVLEYRGEKVLYTLGR